MTLGFIPPSFSLIIVCFLYLWEVRACLNTLVQFFDNGFSPGQKETRSILLLLGSSMFVWRSQPIMKPNERATHSSYECY